MRLLSFLLVAIASLAWSPSVAAQEEDKTAKTTRTERTERTAYLSFSPIHLTRPIGELTGEMKMGRSTSLAIIMGAGAVGGQAYWKFGNQILYYPLGGFENGLQLGLETSYASFAGGLPSGVIVGPVNAITFAPVIGWKWTFASGFTMSTQAGAAYAPSAPEGRQFSALYNLNVGWSF